MQFVSDPTPSPAISDKDINKLQQLTGTLLHYARAFDPKFNNANQRTGFRTVKRHISDSRQSYKTAQLLQHAS
jgi:hypothetical protein